MLIVISSGDDIVAVSMVLISRQRNGYAAILNSVFFFFLKVGGIGINLSLIRCIHQFYLN